MAETATAAAPTNPPATAAPAPKPGAMERIIGSRLRQGTTQEPKEELPAKPPEGTPTKETPAAAQPAVTPPPPNEEVKPAKRTIRRAKAYEDVPPPVDNAAAKLAEAADKLSKVAEKVVAHQPAPEPTLDLSQEEQKQLRVLEAMGEMDKTRFGHLAGNAKRFLTDFPKAEEKWSEKFQAEWTRKNGENFDSDEARDAAYNEAYGSAHEKFVRSERAKYKLEYSDDEFVEGAAYLREKPLREKQERTERELQAIREKQAAEATQGSARTKSSEAIADLSVQLGKVNAEFDGLLNEDGTPNEDAAKKVKDAKTVLPILTEASKHASAFAEAAVVVERGGESKLAPLVFGAIRKYEEEKLASAPNEQDEQGRTFTTVEKYAKMKPEEQAKHWIVDAERLIAFSNDKLLEMAMNSIKAKRDEAAEIRKALMEEYGITEEQAAALAAKKNANAPAAAPAKPVTAKPPMATTTDGKPGTAAPASNGSSWFADRFKQPVIAGGLTQSG